MSYRTGLVLSFGVITLIVSADPIKEKEESLSSVCCGVPTQPHAPTQVRQQLKCSTCNEIVAHSDLKKAKKVGDCFVVVEQQEIATARDSVLGATKKMLGITVHPAVEVAATTLQKESVYLLSPDGAPQIGAYGLLADSIARHPEYAFLTQWTPVFKASLFRLEVFEGVLVMKQLCWPEDVKAVPALDLIEALPEHQTMIDNLLPTLSKPFEVSEYSNRYAAELAALVASKEAVEGVATEREKSAPKAVGVGGVDLTAALSAMMKASGS